MNPRTPRLRNPVETWHGANEARFEKLRIKKLRRVAKAQGFSLRQSDRGFSLVDGLGGFVLIDERQALTLDEVERRLTQP